MRKAHICFFILSVAAVRAQDLHFSQFLEHPSLLNPALTGATGHIRASASFKDQWRSVTTPYRTMGATLEMRRMGQGRKKKRVGKFGSALKRNGGRLAGGLSVYK